MMWSELAQAKLPGGDVLTLRQSGADFEIRFNLWELMSSRNPASERALARLACAKVDRQAARVLIGGLGMGYTVRAVLDEVGADARLTVAELVPEVVAWNRGPLADLAARPLEDPRVTVCNDDVTEVLKTHPASFDIILMDVDNGPEAVLFETNQFLYSVQGVTHILSGLKAGGVFALWAAGSSANFEAVLTTGGFAWDQANIQLQPGPEHIIYLVRA